MVGHSSRVDIDGLNLDYLRVFRVEKVVTRYLLLVANRRIVSFVWKLKEDVEYQPFGTTYLYVSGPYPT